MDHASLFPGGQHPRALVEPLPVCQNGRAESRQRHPFGALRANDLSRFDGLQLIVQARPVGPLPVLSECD